MLMPEALLSEIYDRQSKLLDSSILFENNELEKFGTPHWQHISTRFGYSQQEHYKQRWTFSLQSTWNQPRHSSQLTTRWFHFSALSHKAQGNLGLYGPGLGWRSPACIMTKWANQESTSFMGCLLRCKPND